MTWTSSAFSDGIPTRSDILCTTFHIMGEQSCGSHVESFVRPLLCLPPLPSSVVTPALDIFGCARAITAAHSSGEMTPSKVATTGSGSLAQVR